MNVRILGLLNEIIDHNIKEDNFLKQRAREEYIKRVGGLMGYTEITGVNFNIFHLRALKELIEEEQKKPCCGSQS